MVNEIENIQDLLKKLSLKVVGYDDGDIMFLSDLSDDILIIKNIPIENKQFSEQLFIIEEKINHLLSGGENSNFIDEISDLIDLLVTLLDNNTNEKILTQTPSDKDENTHILSRDYDLESETMKIFLLEAEERITQGQEIILELENDMENRKIIDDLFRIFHTIKGECGFLNLVKLGEITHNLENLLDMLRYSEIENNIDIIDIILSGVDIISDLLSSLKSLNHEEYNNIDISSLVKKIELCTTSVRIPIGQVFQSEGLLNEKQIKEISEEQIKTGYTKQFGQIAKEKEIINDSDIKRTLKKQREIQIQSDSYVKVSVNQINYLVDMIGELIIATNQIRDENIEFLTKITKEIQQTAMMLRTIKIKNLFINMKRVVRDASKNLGKKVVLEMEGGDLEVDRNLVEHLEEPLIHLLRNSVGHGIEEPEIRKECGKDETGKILLKAERVGNQIKITVKDDGAGLNADKILAKAVEKSIITMDHSKKIIEDDIYNLIFAPGFSTSETVDKVSGRGVGMDIVKNTVSSLRGNIHTKTEKGVFTEFCLEFPLIMAIIDSMIILVDGVHFILPVVNIIETLKFEIDSVHYIKNRDKVISIRNEIIPVIDLRDFFNLKETDRSEIELAIIIEYNKKKFAFIVDQIVAKKEVVIKSLGDKLKKIKGISAATILAGGVIGYIINVDEVVLNRTIN